MFQEFLFAFDQIILSQTEFDCQVVVWVVFQGEAIVNEQVVVAPGPVENGEGFAGLEVLVGHADDGVLFVVVVGRELSARVIG